MNGAEMIVLPIYLHYWAADTVSYNENSILR